MKQSARHSIERLFAEQYAALVGFFYRRTRSKADAPDLAQEVYLRMLRVVNQEGFLGELADLAARLGATAVFDGVGGALVTSIAPTLDINSTIYIYGLLAGAAPISLPSVLFLMKNLTLKRFSNFESSTVRDPEKLATALLGLQSCIDDPLFKTRVGQEFRLDQFDAAMSYETVPGAKAVFVP
jgi:NADPH:quinone reductase-like Zn-dependent oxidoreductase